MGFFGIVWGRDKKEDERPIRGHGNTGNYWYQSGNRELYEKVKTEENKTEENKTEERQKGNDWNYRKGERE